MVGGCAAPYGGLIEIANVSLSLIVLVIALYYFAARKKLDELSRRFLLAGFFFGIHEMTFSLGDPFIQELTKTLFFLTLFYALIFIVQQNSALEKNLSEQEKFNQDLKERLEELKKEIT